MRTNADEDKGRSFGQNLDFLIVSADSTAFEVVEIDAMAFFGWIWTSFRHLQRIVLLQVCNYMKSMMAFWAFIITHKLEHFHDASANDCSTDADKFSKIITTNAADVLFVYFSITTRQRSETRIAKSFWTQCLSSFVAVVVRELTDNIKLQPWNARFEKRDHRIGRPKERHAKHRISIHQLKTTKSGNQTTNKRKAEYRKRRKPAHSMKRG